MLKHKRKKYKRLKYKRIKRTKEKNTKEKCTKDNPFLGENTKELKSLFQTKEKMKKY